MVKKCCEVCGSPYWVEEHHIVFRSKASYMANISLNLKYLCNECHRGNRGPHLCRKVDEKYKFELQTKLFEIFNKDYYSEEEIRDLLKTNDIEVRKIVKKLSRCTEGYERLSLVMRLMGGNIYGK